MHGSKRISNLASIRSRGKKCVSGEKIFLTKLPKFLGRKSFDFSHPKNTTSQLKENNCYQVCLCWPECSFLLGCELQRKMWLPGKRTLLDSITHEARFSLDQFNGCWILSQATLCLCSVAACCSLWLLLPQWSPTFPALSFKRCISLSHGCVMDASYL